MPKQFELIAAITSSTNHSLCILFSPNDPNYYTITTGTGLNPLEYNEADFYNILRELTYKSLRDFQRYFHCTHLNITIPLLVIAMEGTNFSEEKELVISCAKDLPVSPLFENSILLVDRGLARLMSIFCDQVGSIISLGTSAFSYCSYRGDHGELVTKKIGGWGILSGYDGGGYDIGRNGLYKVYRDYERGKPYSRFSEFFLNFFKINSMDELSALLKSFLLNGKIRKEVSGLTIPIIQLSEEEYNPESIFLLENAAERAFNNYYELISCLNNNALDQISRRPILLYGGLLQNSKIISERLIMMLRNHYPEQELIACRYRSIVGVIRYALCNLNYSYDDIESILNTILENNYILNVKYKYLDMEIRVTQL